ncbi:glycosyltransferase family 2 protein [Vibrio parahaemolyticus]|uniref:glycosyltransferase family 2 protein n=1 Tax=Vibrio parahaemolyticus TaxID=670 RepID=UPI001120739E|nr:glycosyltransferase family 2 protein [Vibrio parahaemolyticus]TON79130.1 family 2 glycosyl transferase [Vibrio parahaemolyticus]
MHLKTSLIITTYNWPTALISVLRSVENQTVLPDEIIIADDGSTDETVNLLKDYSVKGVKVIHAWQEDLGFRAARARNLAVTKSSGNYLIFIDGDMFLDKNFIEDHIANSQKGIFIQGGRAMMDNALSNWILSGETPSLFSLGLKNRKNSIRNKLLSKLFSKNDKLHFKTRTCNFSCWRSDYMEVNGFDNEYVGWGREDSDFVIRMINNGLTRKYLKFSAIGYHLYHTENSKDNLDKNNLLMESIGSSVQCNNGIRQL